MKGIALRKASQRRHFDQLIRPYVVSMFRTAYRLTGDRDDAEDLVQDVLTALYPQTSKLAAVTDLKPWLARVLHNRYVDTVRKRVRSPETVSNEFACLSAADAGASPDGRLENSELASALRQALDLLAPELRSLVVLHLMEGHTLEQLTAVFNVPLGTLKSRLHTARGRLKKMLALDEPFLPDERVDGYELPGNQRTDQKLRHASR